MFMWIAEAPLKPAPDWATACIITAASVMPSPAPPILLRHGDAEPAAARDGGIEVFREAALAVALQPVGVAEILAQPGDGVADALLLWRKPRHGRSSRAIHGRSGAGMQGGEASRDRAGSRGCKSNRESPLATTLRVARR